MNGCQGEVTENKPESYLSLSEQDRTHILFKPNSFADFHNKCPPLCYGEDNQVAERLPGEELSASANEDDLQNGRVMTFECLELKQKQSCRSVMQNDRRTVAADSAHLQAAEVLQAPQLGGAVR